MRNSERDAGGGLDRRAAAGVFALSLVLCVTFSWLARPLPVTDEFRTYYRIATNVSQGNGFSEDGLRPYVYVPPLFSTGLGAWFYVVGSRSLRSVQLYQSLCIALSTLFLFLLARELFRVRAAALAASLWMAVHPSLWTYAVFVRQEPTILLVTTLACWRTVVWLKNPGTLRSATAGAFWGLATLAKVITLFLPGVLAVLWAWRGRTGDRIRGADLAAATLAFFLVIAPWTVRNYHFFHRFIPVNDQAAGLLEWNVQHSDVEADEGKGWVALLASQLRTKEANRGGLSGERFLAALDREGIHGRERVGKLWEYILAHKRYFLVQRLRNAIFFAAPGVDWWIQSGRLKTGQAQQSVPFLLLALLCHGVLYLCFLWRLLQLFRGRLELPMRFLVLFFGGYWALYALLWGEIRFSIPVYPVLILFAPWERWFGRSLSADTGGRGAAKSLS